MWPCLKILCSLSCLVILVSGHFIQSPVPQRSFVPNQQLVSLNERSKKLVVAESTESGGSDLSGESPLISTTSDSSETTMKSETAPDDLQVLVIIAVCLCAVLLGVMKFLIKD